MRGILMAAAVCTLLLGCGEKIDDAERAVTAAKALMESTQQLKEVGEATQKAEALAEERAKTELPAGASEQETKQFVENAKAMAAMQALGKGDGTPVVNWRQLQGFLPDKLGEYTADGELDGSTNKMGMFTVTTVKRSYKAGGPRARITISDTAMSPMLRAPFAMVSMIDEDSSQGFRKGTKIEGNNAIVEWEKSSKHSKATVLAGQRFLVEVSVSDAIKEDQAASLMKLIDLGALVAVKAEQPAADSEG